MCSVLACVRSICSPGWCSLNTSDICNMLGDTECPSSVCHSHGTCFYSREGDVFCNCTNGYFGTRCESECVILSCFELELCLNGGLCLREENGESSCLCQKGFRGALCEQAIRVYLDDETLCMNGGTPYRQGNTTGCVCNCGNTGEFCEEISKKTYSECWWNICNGHGTCDVNGLCSCFQGFSGRYCEHNLTKEAFTPAVEVNEEEHLRIEIILIAILVPLTFSFFVVVLVVLGYQQRSKNIRIIRSSIPVELQYYREEAQNPIQSNLRPDLSSDPPSYEEICRTTDTSNSDDKLPPPKYSEAVVKYILKLETVEE